MPNVQGEPHGELAQDVPQARPVTDTRVGSTALLGSVVCFLLTLDDNTETEKTAHLLHGENSILSRLNPKQGEYVCGDKNLRFLSGLFIDDPNRVKKAMVLEISHCRTHAAESCVRPPASA